MPALEVQKHHGLFLEVCRGGGVKRLLGRRYCSLSSASTASMKLACSAEDVGYVRVKPYRADTSPLFTPLAQLNLLPLKLYSLNSMYCACIVVAAIGRFIPRNESALHRDHQVAQWPLGSSALCQVLPRQKGSTDQKETSVRRVEGLVGTTEAIWLPFTTTRFSPRVLRNSFTPILAAQLCTCNLVLLWSIYFP